MPSERRSVALLGATGSIGTQTLDVLRLEPDSSNSSRSPAVNGCTNSPPSSNEFRVTRVGVISDAHRDTLAALVGADVDVVVGDDGLAALAASADVVVNAVLGFAGLPVTLSALAAGKRLALANKESLIAAAPLVAKVRATPGAMMLPVDSEHCAIHQCLAEFTGRAGLPRRATTPAHRLRRTVSRLVARPVASRDQGRRAEAPDLVDGGQDHHRLVHADEQGTRGARGLGALRHRRRSRRGRRAPPVDRALHGRVRRRFGARPTLASRHATADRVLPGTTRCASTTGGARSTSPRTWS